MPDFQINDINPYIIQCGHVRKETCPPAGTRYGERQVRWFELELIEWGEGYIVTDGKKLFTKKGDLFFRKPGMVVEGVSPYYCYLIVFDMVYSPAALHRYHLDDPINARKTTQESSNLISPVPEYSIYNFPPLIQLHQFNRIEELFQNIYTAFLRKEEHGQFYMRTYLMQLLMLLLKEWSSSEVMVNARRSFRLNYPKVQGVRRYIEENSSMRLKLDELAEMAGLSPNFFCRIFTEIVGETPVSYINKCRMNCAKKLLIETFKTVKEIAYECGFENDTYFYTLFKRLEGVSPVSYRDKHHRMFKG